MPGTTRQSGFSYVEMLIACIIVLASLGPAIDALRTAQISAGVHSAEVRRHYSVLGRTEELLVEPFAALLAAAAAAGSPSLPGPYSDPLTLSDPVLVYLWFYDLADEDGDGNVFTIADDNADGDNDPFTGNNAIDVAWIRVEIPNSSHAIETLVRR